MTRKIIHCDADCFYAAIEMRDNPNLRNRPIAVGGRADSRGVLSTCNYEARTYGIRSAMPSAQALKLCPDLLIVPHRMDVYKEAAIAMRAIFQEYTEQIEPLSLDEAYLDVSSSEKHHNSATLMAQDIRQRIFADIGITVSAGVANSKFLAKVASDWRKPDGLFVIHPNDIEHFVEALPVNKIHGVGKVTEAKMKRLGITHCADIQAFGVTNLMHHFGSFGSRLWELSQGIDERPVKSSRQRKSLSVERTYTKDLSSATDCAQKLPKLYDELQERLKRLSPDYRTTHAFVKVKFANFSVSTHTETIRQPLTTLPLYHQLLRTTLKRHDAKVRLLGVGVRFGNTRFSGRENKQLELFEG